MKARFLLIINCSLLIAANAAHAAGTYYTPGYQQQYQSGYQQQARPYQQQAAAQTGYYQGASPQYQTNTSPAATQYAQRAGYSAPSASPTTPQKSGTSTAGGSHRGFDISAGASYQSALWDFSMKEAGSNLHFDNIVWAVFDLNAGYAFGIGATSGLKIDAGLQIGSQMSASKMIDDDISHGGALSYYVTDPTTGEPIPGMGVYGHALSIGSSSGGSLLGYYAGVGLTDTIKLGNLRMTPSVGYRSLSYNLKTKHNYGMAMDTGYCETVNGGEIQCLPAIILNPSGGGVPIVIWDDPNIPGGVIDTGNTFYYEEPGTSHNYKVDWSGPYLALDAAYDINQYNSVGARFEIGLPGYNSSGDQPYRVDWAKPVQDSAPMFSAMHLGFLANYTTAITESVGFTVGLTYDYYSVSGADAKTTMNSNLYWDIVNNQFGGDEAAAIDPNTGSAMAIHLNQTYNECGGWICKQSGEINSFYRSVGIRAGISAKF